jgi:hypothetical protein
MSDPGSSSANGARDADDAANDMTPEEKRRDQLLRMAGSSEADVAPRIDVTEHDGVKRIDIPDSAAVRPGLGPGDPDESKE